MSAPSAADVPPLHFVVPVWGAAYIDLFLTVTLPTLLAPRNIPGLPNLDACAFHIITMPDSVETVRAAPSFQRLAGLLPAHIHCFEGFDSNKYTQMSWGHLRGMALANEAEAATVFLNADMVFSDGSFESIARILASGKRVIEIEGVRTNKPGMVAGLRTRFFDPATQAIAVPPRRLVRLMLDNLHRMTLSHFWEAEDEQGFMPFHTYFRVGRNGLIARSTHLYPFVVHPRHRVPLDSITTIDWDLVDKVCPDPQDSHVVLDSDEILSAEMSDPDYYVKPWYARRDVEQFRDDFFLNTHCCSKRHRDVLRHVITFNTGRTDGPDWRLVRRRVDAWYRAVMTPAPQVPAKLWDERLRCAALMRVAALVAPARAGALPPRLRELVGTVLRARFRRSFNLYIAAQGRLGPAYDRCLAAAAHRLAGNDARAWLDELDRLYMEAFRTISLPAVETADIDLGGTFLGIGWGDEEFLFGQSLRRLGPDNTGTVMLCLRPGDYDLELFVYSAPDNQIQTVRVEVDGHPLPETEVAWITDRYRLKAVLPRAVVEQAGGRVALLIGGAAPDAQLPADPPRRSGFSFTRLALRMRATVQEALPAIPAAGSRPATPGIPIGAQFNPARVMKRRRVRMLVALWGESYIRLFSRHCLPTLLAPGNLPALAALHDFDLVFLTGSGDRVHFEACAEYHALRSRFRVELLPIDDVLAEWWNPRTNAYGIVLTMAFHKGIMSMGEAQLDTHFVFWNADFCVSDGSFRHLAQLIGEGHRGILAPSLRVDEYSFVAEMPSYRDADGAIIAIPPRRMTRMALDNLHPTVQAKMVNHYTRYVTRLGNQFYWKIDDDLLVARNFLLFMLCIRPERICREIATYCDYGFIPEMVPSGDIHTVVDSDDMLLIELQDPNKEFEHSRVGPPADSLDPGDYQAYVSEWSTAEHRANSRVLTLFRAGDRAYDMAAIQATTDRFMDTLYAGLFPEPRWHNSHPYWEGTILAMGRPYATSLPRSRHSRTLRAKGIDFDLYAFPQIYFNESWRELLAAQPLGDTPSDAEAAGWLDRIDQVYYEHFYNSGVPYCTEMDIDLGRGFAGTRWAPVDVPGGPRRVGPSGTSDILIRLQPGRVLYRGALHLHAGPGGVAACRVRINGNEAPIQRIRPEGDHAVIDFFFPRGYIDTSNGNIALGIVTAQAGDRRIGPPSDVACSRLVIGSVTPAEAWRTLLPLIDQGDLGTAGRLFDDLGPDDRQIPANRLLILRQTVLAGSGWVGADPRPLLRAPLDHDQIEAVFAIADSVLRRDGAGEPAMAMLQAVTRAAPGHGEAWFALSRAARLAGRFEVALTAMSHAVELAGARYMGIYPDVAEAVDRGLVASPAHHYLEQGAAENRQWPAHLTVGELRVWLAIRPWEPDAKTRQAAWFVLPAPPAKPVQAPAAPVVRVDVEAAFKAALDAHREDRLEAAEAGYRDILRAVPGHPHALNNLAILLKTRQRHDEAEALYRGALAAAPQEAHIHCNLGCLLVETGRPTAGAAFLRRSLALQPNHAEGVLNLGRYQRSRGDTMSALAICARALVLQPTLVDAMIDQGELYRGMGQTGAAIESFVAALKLRPDLAFLYRSLGDALREQGRPEDAVAILQKGLGRHPADAAMHSSLLLAINHAKLPAELVARVHRHWGEQHADPLLPAAPRGIASPDPGRRLRLGYLGPECMAEIVEPLIRAHDRAAVEVFCYHTSARGDDRAARFQSAADQWRSLVGLDDAEAAALIARDRIDILVDIAGHGDGRPLVLARRPAAVQAAWLGYPNSTGMRAVDVRLTDDVADPPGAHDRWYTERLVRLPLGLFAFRLAFDAAAAGPPSLLATGRITFGCLDDAARVTGEVVRAWAAILQRVPDSRLLLQSWQFGERLTVDRLAALFAKHGIGRERLEMRGLPARTLERLQTHNRVDIALDPFPCNGTLATAEALWMGVPVVTLAGTGPGQRVGASLLSRCGLPDLVATDEAGYVDMAAALALDPHRLADLRRGMRARLAASPLADQTGFARSLEAVYRTLWRDRLAEVAPAAVFS